MTPNEYQQLAFRTAKAELDFKQQLTNGALGLTGESGEVADLVKKHLYQGHGIISVLPKIKEELGDVLWYVALIASATGTPLEDIMQANIDKLRKRYPDGFDPERSVHRDE